MAVQVFVCLLQLCTVPPLFQGSIYMVCAPQSQSPLLRPFEEFNILLEKRGPEVEDACRAYSRTGLSQAGEDALIHHL